ncbi:glutamine amidotransferase [Ralstonia solanacearum]|nr:glutamine amidotransferase [Ralstonia solanacearum]
MAGLYRVTRPDGSVEYTDMPNGPGVIDTLGSRGRSASTADDRSKDYKQGKTLVKEVQKRAPKIKDYLEYLEFLRNYRPLQFEQVMRDLQREDPQTWMKLQKYPQFRPLRDTAIGLKAAEKNIGAGIGLLTGNVTGSVEKWLETTVKDMMKRDRWGPYADVLGAKASTLLEPPPTTYSNSRWGQFAKVEDPKAVQAAKAATKAMETSQAAIRASRAAAVTRVLSPWLDLGIGALDPNVHSGATNFAVELKLRHAYEAGKLDEEQYFTAHNLMAQGKFKEMQDYLSSLSRSNP